MPQKFEEVKEILEPGRRYWMVMPIVDGTNLWNSYREVLKGRYGKNAFRTVETWENPKEGEGWAVIDVKKDMMVDGTGVLKYGEHKRGDNPQSLGLWSVPKESWTATASDVLDRTTGYVERTTGYIERVALLGGGLMVLWWLIGRDRK